MSPTHHIFINIDSPTEKPHHKRTEVKINSDFSVYFYEDTSCLSLFSSSETLTWDDLQPQFIMLYFPGMQPRTLKNFLVRRPETFKTATGTGKEMWNYLLVAISEQVQLDKMLPTVCELETTKYYLSKEEQKYFHSLQPEILILEEEEMNLLKKILKKVENGKELTHKERKLVFSLYPSLEFEKTKDYHAFNKEITKKCCKSVDLFRAKQCRGKTKQKEQCKRRVRGGSYCFQHVSQAREDNTRSLEVIPPKKKSSISQLTKDFDESFQCQGKTKQKEQCKRRVRGGSYCFQHVSQAK